MGGKAAIEILVMTYNRSALLPATLETLLAQTVPAASIRIVDNGSTDRTGEIARSFASRGVGYFRRDVNDLAACWIDLQRMPAAEWVMVFHDDDLLHPGYLNAVSDVIGAFPEATLVGSAMKAEAAPDARDWDAVSPKRTTGLLSWREFARELYAGFPFPFCSAVYRTEGFRRTVGDTGRYGKIFDRPFVMEVARAGGAVLLTDAFVKYRVHPNQDSRDCVTGPFPSELLMLQRYYREALGEDPWSRSGRTFLKRNYRNLSSDFDRLRRNDPDGRERENFFRDAIAAGAASPSSLRIGAAYAALTSIPRRLERSMKGLVREKKDFPA
jgi:glycosyltransferase involved in cell wall biosynthesis